METYRWSSSNNPGPRIWFTSKVTRGRLEYLAVHEFGHALGFVHEQDRPEAEALACRDSLDGPNGNGGVGDDSAAPLTPYDGNSVMNYCNQCNNECGDITELDKKGIAKVYGYPRSVAAPTRSRKPVAGSFTTSRSEVGRTDVSYLQPALRSCGVAMEG